MIGNPVVEKISDKKSRKSARDLQNLVKNESSLRWNLYDNRLGDEKPHKNQSRNSKPRPKTSYRNDVLDLHITGKNTSANKKDF